jgi:hypothetical protein
MNTSDTLKPDEVSESLKQWIGFCSLGPNPARGGEVLQEPGLAITCCRTLWPIGNMAVFTAPVESLADLLQRVKTAHECFAARSCAGVFFIADNLGQTLGAQVPAEFARYGYMPTLAIIGMAADALADPVRPLPALRYCAVSDPESRRTVAELNAIAYEVPPEWGQDFYERFNVWDHGAFGIIGYFKDRPAACAVTVPLNGRLYVALVATAHEFRRLGCAEAVMRRSLEVAAGATGLTRTVLHASPMGRPLYSQMGYHDTLPFKVYAREEGK